MACGEALLVVGIRPGLRPLVDALKDWGFTPAYVEKPAIPPGVRPSAVLVDLNYPLAPEAAAVFGREFAVVGLSCCGSFDLYRLSGLRAVVDLDAGPAELGRVVRAAVRGKAVYVGTGTPGALGPEDVSLPGLLACGLTDAEMAGQLGCAERRVRYRVGRRCRIPGLKTTMILGAAAGHPVGA